MDDLIVIILTLIVAGFGALGQLRKKKQMPASEEEPLPPQGFWDLIQGESPGSPSEVAMDSESQEFVEEPQVAKKEPDYGSHMSQFSMSPGEEGMSESPQSPRSNKGKKMKSRLLKDFSLRKAVVYSEILNRKYE